VNEKRGGFSSQEGMQRRRIDERTWTLSLTVENDENLNFESIRVVEPVGNLRPLVVHRKKEGFRSHEGPSVFLLYVRLGDRKEGPCRHLEKQVRWSRRGDTGEKRENYSRESYYGLVEGGEVKKEGDHSSSGVEEKSWC